MVMAFSHSLAFFHMSKGNQWQVSVPSAHTGKGNAFVKSPQMKNEPTSKILSQDQAKINIPPAGFIHSAEANQATKVCNYKCLL